MTRFSSSLGQRIVQSSLPLIFDRVETEALMTARFVAGLKNMEDVHHWVYAAYMAKYATKVLKERCDMIIVTRYVTAWVIGWIEHATSLRPSQPKENIGPEKVRKKLILGSSAAGVSKYEYEKHVILDKKRHIKRTREESKELIKIFKKVAPEEKVEAMEEMKFTRTKNMISLAIKAFESDNSKLKDEALKLLCYLSIDYKIPKRTRERILSQIKDRNLHILVRNVFEYGEEPTNIIKVNNEQLKVSDDKKTLFYKGKEIPLNPEDYGDSYVLHVQETIGSKLKACINCKNFQYTPLGIDMSRAFKGRCKLKFNRKEGYSNYIIPIYFICKDFKFEAYDFSKRIGVIETINKVLGGAVEK